ncbi:MAG: sigma-70 family RNA polymerase sigma factor [Phycisphaerales bacterium]|nr:MAG: sigma-70 family RNA polymerase sigma factor [Phycisphaerales bacterium]
MFGEVSITVTDEQCIKLCLNSHPDAYRQLVRRYQGPLVSYLIGRLGGLERAEEAAQETFVRAFFALGKLKTPESFFSWLLGIAGRVVKEGRRAQRRSLSVISSSPERSAAPEPAGDYLLEEAVAGLPEKYAEVVLLRYYGELSCAEVADRLGVPVGTVTKRLSRAYGMLRDSLGGQDGKQEKFEVRS